MRNHQKLTIVGMILLAATYLISNHETNLLEIGFNFASSIISC